MDIRTLLFIIIVAVSIIIGLGFSAFLWCILLALIIVALVTFRNILIAEGKINDFKKWRKRIWKKYQKLETKLFKFWDEL